MASKKTIFAEDLFLSVRDDPEIDGKNFARFKEHIDNAPDAVKHGRWELVEYQSSPFGVDQEYQCSICGTPADYENITRYCPNCGARMDGGNEDAER